MTQTHRVQTPTLWAAAVGGVYALLLYIYRDLTPFYDGGIYYASIRRLVMEPFAWGHLHMEGHISPVYTLLISWSQFLRQGAVLPMYATNMLLLFCATICMYKLLTVVLGQHTHKAERVLAASVYGGMPVLLAHALHINLDFGLSVFLVPYVYFLLTKRPWVAVPFGCALMLTKETGVLIYLLVVAAYIVVYIAQPARSVRAAVQATVRSAALFVPGVVFGAYYGAFRLFASQAPAHWGVDSVGANVVRTLLDFNLADSGVRSFLANTFILNCNWLFSVVLLAFVLHRAWRWMFGLNPLPRTNVHGQDLLFLCILLVGLVYITTRVRFWNNPRYVLAVFPVLIPLAVYCLSDLIRRANIRIAFWSVTLTLILLSNVTTLDPVSRAVYGTIPFGSHAWLDMTSMIGPSWLRRDPQAYNLEFFELHYAVHEAFADIQPAPDTLVVAGPSANFYFANRLEPGTFRPTLQWEGTHPLRIADRTEDLPPDRLLPMLGNQPFILYLALPNLDNDQFLPILAQYYELAGSRTYGRRGYEVSVLFFVRP